MLYIILGTLAMMLLYFLIKLPINLGLSGLVAYKNFEEQGTIA